LIVFATSVTKLSLVYTRRYACLQCQNNLVLVADSSAVGGILHHFRVNIVRSSRLQQQTTVERRRVSSLTNITPSSTTWHQLTAWAYSWVMPTDVSARPRQRLEVAYTDRGAFLVTFTFSSSPSIVQL